jgi:uncharacterized membrane protein
MKKNNQKYINIASYSVLALAILSLILGVFTNLNHLESFRIVFGSIYVLFLPGFVMSFIFFSKTKEFESKNEEGIDWIERIALSFALSIAIVPLAVFYLNLVGVRINLLNSSLTILGIILISFGILYYKNKKSA